MGNQEFLKVKRAVNEWKLDQKGQLRAKRLRILKDQGMDFYIEEIKAQRNQGAKMEERIVQLLCSKLDLNSEYILVKRTQFLNPNNEESKEKIQKFEQTWENDRKEIINKIVKEKELFIDEAVIDNMGEWTHDTQVRMAKRLIKKDNSFENEFYIAEVCRSDDFYQTFGFDEEEVKAYVELTNVGNESQREIK